MNLEHQVCSLELAKKLKELGVKQESLFYWTNLRYSIEKEEWEWVNDNFITIENVKPNIPKGKRNDWIKNKAIIYSAFTVAELGEILPADYVYHTRIMDTNLGKRRIDLTYQELKSGQPQGNVWKGTGRADTEADARAKMLIYLLENKLTNLSL